MFISCPHCRELVAIDRETRLAPEMCPRCGGVLRKAQQRRPPPRTCPPRGSAVSSVSCKTAKRPRPLRPKRRAQTGAEPIDDETPADPASLEDASEESAESKPARQPIDEATPWHRSTGNRRRRKATRWPHPLPRACRFRIGATHASASGNTQFHPPDRTTRHAPAHRQVAMGDVIVLSLALVLQVLLADRARLAADAAWRPLIPLSAARWVVRYRRGTNPVRSRCSAAMSVRSPAAPAA